jgi:hypothetical protein
MFLRFLLLSAVAIAVVAVADIPLLVYFSLQQLGVFWGL